MKACFAPRPLPPHPPPPQVRKDSLNHEFFERQFMPGVHYVAADTVQDVPDAIRRLQVQK